LRLVLVQARAQLTSISRNRRAIVISLVIPVVILVMFNSIFGGGSDTVDLAGARITAPRTSPAPWSPTRSSAPRSCRSR
jgi:hypothetical protein